MEATKKALSRMTKVDLILWAQMILTVVLFNLLN